MLLLFQQLDDMMNSTLECIAATEFMRDARQQSLLGLCLAHPGRLELAWLLQTIMTVLVLALTIPCVYASIWHRISKARTNKEKLRVNAILERHEAQRLVKLNARRTLRKQDDAPRPPTHQGSAEARLNPFQTESQQPSIMFMMPTLPQIDQSIWTGGAARYTSRPGAKRDNDMVLKRSSRVTSYESINEAVSPTGTMKKEAALKRTKKGGIIRAPSDTDSTNTIKNGSETD